MKLDYTIATCTPADYQIIANIYNHYIPPNGHTMETNLKTKEDIQQWVERFNEREQLYVLKIKEEVIGWGIIKRYSDRGGYEIACETALYLQPDQLGKGYGTLLKKHLLKECKALGYHHIVAKIWASNTASIVYNQKVGYEIVGTQREVGFKNGEWVDVVIMQYIIG